MKPKTPLPYPKAAPFDYDKEPGLSETQSYGDWVAHNGRLIICDQ